jgi:hypothetical protein
MIKSCGIRLWICDVGALIGGAAANIRRECLRCIDSIYRSARYKQRVVAIEVKVHQQLQVCTWSLSYTIWHLVTCRYVHIIIGLVE